MATPQPPRPQQGQPPPGRKPPTIKEMLENKKDALAEMAGKYLDVNKLLKIALNCVMKKPDLGACTQQSLLQSVVQCAEWGVYPGEGALAQAYLIPRDVTIKTKDAKGITHNHYEKQCQAMLSYQGMLTQVRRATKGHLLDIEARIVHEGDKFNCRFGFNPMLEHEPDYAEAEEGSPLLVYALARIKGQEFPHVEVLPWARVEKIRSISKAKDNGPWVLWPEEMAKKTALRQLVKYLPNFIELEQAIQADDEGSNVIDGQATRVETGVTAPPPPSNVKPMRRALPEASVHQTLEFTRPEAVPVGETVDQNTGEVLEAEPQAQEEVEGEDPYEAMRRADEATKTEAAAIAAASGPAPAQPQGQLGIDFSVSDITDQVLARMRAVAEDPDGTTDQLMKLAKLSDRCPAERRPEIGPIYTKLRATIVARRKA